MWLSDKINQAIKNKTIKKAGGVEELEEGIYGKKIHLSGSFEEIKRFMENHRTYKAQPGATETRIVFYQDAKDGALAKYLNCQITLKAAKEGGTDVIIVSVDEAFTAATVNAFKKKFG